MDRKKVLELDKICRLCISERKEMRPLFSEKVPEMLMDCTNVRVEPTEGWPDKICVQCVHAVSRNHAFKTLVERSDKELREYIRGLTVALVMEEQQAATAKQQLQLERKQQRLLQKQQKLLDEQLHQQQQQQQQIIQQQQTPAKPKLKPLLRKGSRQQKQRHLEAAPAPAPQPAPQPQMQLMPDPAPPPPTLQQQIQQIQLPTLQPAPTQLLSTAGATTTMPQQILLPNGQLITTAQIVAPQLAQIISTTQQATANGQATAAQSQFLPQLLQTPNGQTLQIVQQPNGTQTLQLVQLVPQRSLAPTGVTTVTTTTNATDMGQHVGASLADADVQLLEDSCEVEDDDLDEVYEQLDVKGEHSFETIVLDDDQQQDFLKDQHEHHQVMINEDLTQSESQENEYFDDLDQQQAIDEMEDEDEHLKHEEDQDTFIIEEIQLEDEEMLDDPDAEELDQDCEFIADEQDPHLSGDVDEDLQYAIMEPPDGEASVDIDQAFLDSDQAHNQQQQQQEELQSISLENAVVEFSQATATADALVAPTLSVSSASPTPKRAKRGNQASVGVTLEPCDHQPPTAGPTISSKLAAANSRQLVQTASVIAAAGADDNYEIDANLVTEFIRQHTSPLGSGRYICHLCSTEFRQFKGLQNHMHSHTNWIRANCKKQPQCEICLKSFKGPGMLRMHMKTHDAESSTPVCTICNRTFKSKAILYRHRQTHQQRAYCCGVANCRKNFSSAVNLKWHVERKHPDVVEPLFKCGECGNLYDSVDSLQMHVESTDHSADVQMTGQDDAFSGAMSIVSNGTTDMSNMMATGQSAALGGGAGDTHAVVVGSSGEVYFVTQA
ncbi:zinc finger protein 853 [Drosophila rhopaloa]|uniref:Zinc finger protein 853 n=1 Tax=Drosophila rhopaloa TaxID=1041015 RepID=A0A6P4EIM8_DRORH|nr:zinc finger protein 853 [Drosophila rhopaloa]